MSDLTVTDRLFFAETGLDRTRVEAIVRAALARAEDGELFLEYGQSESFAWDDGRLKSASFDASRGFGLRAVVGEVTGYAHASEMSHAALQRAAATVRAVQDGYGGRVAVARCTTKNALYTDLNPLGAMPFERKIALLADIDAYARGRDPRVKQVMASVSGSWSAVQIVCADGSRHGDIRPLVRLNVSIVAAQGGRMESGSSGAGGRVGYERYFAPQQWQAQVDEALRQALVNLDSKPAPAGEMSVVLGPGWPGILLHEAIGHGLEGDFNRKRTSAFSGLLGQKVAAPEVTVVDDGALPDRRGSIAIDDEGTASACTVLIENGVLQGYLQDRLNARLMGVTSTGNGRRESFAYPPMPRMTNTMMLNGPHTPEEVLASVRNGLYAVHFGGGQVDITSGKFVFSASEAYLIENGRIAAPVKGATLIGNGPDALTRIVMVGNDSRLDDGIGTCGKDGQSVPVGVGQPTLRIDGLTVGGTA